jgi:hypothetical protein
MIGLKITYFVVDIGTWLHGKKVLMSPSAIIGVDAPSKTIAAFTKQQVQKARTSAHKPEGLEQPRLLSLPRLAVLPGLNDLNDSEAYDDHLRSSSG